MANDRSLLFAAEKNESLKCCQKLKVTYTLTFTDTYMHTQIITNTYTYIYIYTHMLSLLLCMPHEVIMYIDRKQPTLRSPIVIPFHSKLYWLKQKLNGKNETEKIESR